MTSSAIAAANVQLQIGAGDTVPGPETFVTVAEVTGLDVDIQQDQVESTHFQSGGWKDFVPTNKSMSVNFEGNYLPTDNTQDGGAGVLYHLKTNAIKNAKIIFPDTTTFTYKCLTTRFSTGPKQDGILTFSATHQVTGQPTLA